MGRRRRCWRDWHPDCHSTVALQPVVGGHFPESGLDTVSESAVGRGGESGRQRTKSPLWPNGPLKMPAWDGAPRVSHSTVALHAPPPLMSIPRCLSAEFSAGWQWIASLGCQRPTTGATACRQPTTTGDPAAGGALAQRPSVSVWRCWEALSFDRRSTVVAGHFGESGLASWMRAVGHGVTAAGPGPSGSARASETSSGRWIQGKDASMLRGGGRPGRPRPPAKRAATREASRTRAAPTS